jgi:hypothetical protein
MSSNKDIDKAFNDLIQAEMQLQSIKKYKEDQDLINGKFNEISLSSDKLPEDQHEIDINFILNKILILTNILKGNDNSINNIKDIFKLIDDKIELINSNMEGDCYRMSSDTIFDFGPEVDNLQGKIDLLKDLFTDNKYLQNK